MGSGNLRRRCEQKIRELHLPQPFDMDKLRQILAAERGKSLTFHPLPQPTSPGLPSGMWLATERGDHVFYDAQTRCPFTGWLREGAWLRCGPG